VDPDRISRVLLHVLTHAYTSSPKGSPVTITLQQAEGRAIITVRDMGIGPAEEVLPHLFEPFSRVPQAEIQVDSPDGLGLGLYISRKIVERHAGSIEIQSRPGGGRTCWLVLPLAADPSRESTESTPLALPEPCLFPVPHWLVS
jgi:signal transduction histidine kinase